MGILVFALPNTFFVAAIIFAIAALDAQHRGLVPRGLGLLVADIIASVLTQKLDNEKLAAIVDPFGNDAFALMTKYWTVADRNTHALGFTGMLLWNRLIWVAAGIVIFAFGYWRFSFSERATATKKKKAKDAAAAPELKPLILGGFTLDFSAGARWKQFLATVRLEYRPVAEDGDLHCHYMRRAGELPYCAHFYCAQGFGLTTRPVTYALLQIIQGSLYMFLVALITFFAGVLVWEERDARTDEVQDALPVPEWPNYLAKFIALMTAIASIEVLVMIVAVCVQAAHGYTRFQLGLYIETLAGPGAAELWILCGDRLFHSCAFTEQVCGLLRFHWSW